MFYIHLTNKFSEDLYWIYSRRIMYDYDTSDEIEAFRFLYDVNRKVLTIHYFEMESKKLSCELFLETKSYVKTLVVNSKVDTKVFLNRNKRKKKYMILYKANYKIACFIIRI